MIDTFLLIILVPDFDQFFEHDILDPLFNSIHIDHEIFEGLLFFPELFLDPFQIQDPNDSMFSMYELLFIDQHILIALELIVFQI